MEMNERIKMIRNKIGLTQTDFGIRIGLKQNTVGQIENGQRGITDRTIILLCQTYNVSEDWLRDGTGEMFVEDDNFLLSSLSQQYGLDGLDRKIIEAYINLPDMQRGVIKSFVRNLVDNVLAEENYEEYREDYIKTKAAPMAARRGNIDGLQEAADLYDKAKEGDTEA